MSILLGVTQSQLLAKRGGTLAAATVLAGAGLVGVAAVGPELPDSPFGVVQHETALIAFPTFAESLQTLLDDFGMGDLNDFLGKFSDSLGISTPYTIDTSFGTLLGAFNPDGTTFGQLFDQLGIPLGIPLYSDSGASLLGSATFLIGGVSVPNPFVFNAPASFFTSEPGELAGYTSSINGTLLGDVGLSKLVDLLLGGAGEGDNHTVPELAAALGFDLNQNLPALGGLSGVFGWLVGLNTYQDALSYLAGTLSNFNVAENDCSSVTGLCDSNYVHPDLSLNSSVNDWLSGLLQTSTTDVTRFVHSWSGLPVFGHEVITQTTLPGTTFGEYLQAVPWGTGTNDYLGDQSLASLLGLDPAQTWNDYLSNMLFGSTLFHEGTSTWGSQTIGDMLQSWLPDDSGLTIGPETSITDILEAFGLLW
ncbi:hypothetical protein [Mycolicibacter sinensis]